MAVVNFYCGAEKKNIYGCSRSLLLCVLSLVVGSGGYSLFVVPGLHAVVASLVVGHGLLGIWSSAVAAWEKAMAPHSGTLAWKIP